MMEMEMHSTRARGSLLLAEALSYEETPLVGRPLMIPHLECFFGE